MLRNMLRISHAVFRVFLLGMLAGGSFAFLGQASASSKETAAEYSALGVKPQGFGVAEQQDLLVARQRALDLAGAFSNDGYKLRDGTWSFFLHPGQPKCLRVFLFEKNEYWFCAATAMPGVAPSLALYSAEGEAQPAQIHSAEGNVALGFIPQSNGIYLIRILWNAPKPDEAVPFCLVYSYK